MALELVQSASACPRTAGPPHGRGQLTRTRRFILCQESFLHVSCFVLTF